MFETVVEKLIDSGEVKVWKAKEIIESIVKKEVKGQPVTYLTANEPKLPTGYGKIILLGEHSRKLKRFGKKEEDLNTKGSKRPK